MTLLQSRKSMHLLAAIWDIVGKPVTRLDKEWHDRPDYNGTDYREMQSGTLRLWKRQGKRLYSVNVRYMVPTGQVPANGFPVMAFCLDHSAASNRECQDFTRRFGLGGSVVIIVELPANSTSAKQQAQTFLEATWLTLARRVGALADSPPKIDWWGPGAAVGAVVEQAARLRHTKYFLSPGTVLTRPLGPAREVAEIEWKVAV
jgi:hypothetical protein